jgi:hypothetical protein
LNYPAAITSGAAFDIPEHGFNLDDPGQERVEFLGCEVLLIPGGKQAIFQFRQGVLRIHQEMLRVLILKTINSFSYMVGEGYGSPPDVHNPTEIFGRRSGPGICKGIDIFK